MRNMYKSIVMCFICMLIWMGMFTCILVNIFKKPKSFSDEKYGIRKNKLYRFINNRRMGIKSIYEEACEFKEGFAPVKRDGKWGVINEDGNEVIPCIYDEIGIFHGDNEKLVYIVGDNELLFEYEDETGNKTKRAIAINEIKDYFQMDSVVVKKDGKCGLCDKNGYEIRTLLYDEILWMSEGLIGVCKSNKLGYINENGREIIPCIYDDAWCFSDGVAGVKKNEKWGFIDKEENEVIPFIYDGVGMFSEGLVHAEKNEKWGFIDKGGNEVIPFIYSSADEFSEGLVCVEKDEKWGFIDKNGREVIPFIYDMASRFYHGKAIVEIGDNLITINKNGEKCSEFDM